MQVREKRKILGKGQYVRGLEAPVQNCFAKSPLVGRGAIVVMAQSEPQGSKERRRRQGQYQRR